MKKQEKKEQVKKKDSDYFTEESLEQEKTQEKKVQLFKLKVKKKNSLDFSDFNQHPARILKGGSRSP